MAFFSIFQGAGTELAKLVKSYNNLELKMGLFEKNLTILDTELRGFINTSRDKQEQLTSRVATLEAERKVLEELVRNMKAETSLELRAIKAEAIADLKVHYAGAYTDFLLNQTKPQKQLENAPNQDTP